MRSFDIASTGAIAQASAVDNIANNIANVNTVSFKKGYFATTDLPYETERRAGGAVSVNSNVVVPTSIQYGAGVAVSAIIRDQHQGDAINTANQLDVRIDGPGYFVLNMPDGTQTYTRAGRFQIDPNTNQIVTSLGYVVAPGINIPPDYTNILIKNDGTVLVTLPNNPTPEEQGQIEMAMFVNPAGLQMNGDNIYSQTDASGDAQLGTAGQDNYGRFLAGWLEGSNVDPIIEMTDLVKAQRGYEMNVKVISTSDQMMEDIANV
jgi:flagellar basal-body rod protein FlgG